MAHTTMEAWRRNGQGPPYSRIGERVHRYRLSDLEAFVAARRVETRMPRGRRTANHADAPMRVRARRGVAQPETVGDDALRRALWKACDAAGSAKKWAAANGFLAANVYKVLNGSMAPWPRLAEVMGFEYVVVVHYRREKPPSAKC